MQPDVPRSTVIAVVAATTLAQVASAMSIAVFPVIAPRLAAEINVVPATIGYQVSLIFGAATLASPVMSFAVGHWGACRAMQVGLSLCAFAMALALSATLPALAIASILIGVTMTFLTPASGHLLFRFGPPQNLNLIFGLKQTGVPLGWTIVALAAPGITLAFGWRWAVAAVLVIALAIVVMLQRVRARWDDDRKPGVAMWVSPMAGLRVTWRYPVLRWLSAASFALSFVQLCASAFLVTMLVEEVGYSLVAAGLMLSVMQAAGVAGRIVSGWIADRTGDSLGLLKKIAITTAAGCIGSAFLGPGWPPALMALFFFVFGAVAVGWNGLFLAEVARRSPPGMVSVATSGAMTWNFAGILVGPALFATFYHVIGGYAWAYAGLSIVALFGAGALHAAMKHTGRRHAPAAAAPG